MPFAKFPFARPSKAVKIERPCYTMASVNGNEAEITMYGEIVETQPIDWWTDRPIEGQFILENEFLDDLTSVSGCKKLTIRMDSLGGDAGVSILIHNRLRELAAKGTELVCIVDGVAMSGGSLIMCACDTVRVNPSSLVMIHKCWCSVCGGYNADELRQMANSNDAWDKSQVSIYKRKCNLSDTVISHLMAETTYMTGKEAVEKGFADELMEDADPLDISASADGRSLIVHGRQMHLSPGMFAPDNIPTVKPEASAAVKTNKNQPAQTGSQNGGKTMANTLEELRKENPQLAEQLMAEARAAAATPAAAAPAAPAAASPAAAATPSAPSAQTTPATPAVSTPATPSTPDPAAAERQRLQDIDAVAGLFDAETVNAAKYGDNACTAQEMTFRAAQKATQQGKAFLTNLEADASKSGAQNVTGAASTGAGGAGDGKDLTPQQLMAQGRADAKALNKTDKEEK